MASARSGFPVDGVSPYRLALAVAFGLVAVAVVVLTNDPLTRPFVAMFVVLGELSLLASSFDVVRAHPLYDVGHAVSLTALFVLWYVAADRSPVLAGLAVLAAAGVVVEAYNYRHGTSYLRIDF